MTAVTLFGRLTIEGNAVAVGCDSGIASETFEMLTTFLCMDGISSTTPVEVVVVCPFDLLDMLSFFLVVCISWFSLQPELQVLRLSLVCCGVQALGLPSGDFERWLSLSATSDGPDLLAGFIRLSISLALANFSFSTLVEVLVEVTAELVSLPAITRIGQMLVCLVGIADFSTACAFAVCLGIFLIVSFFGKVGSKVVLRKADIVCSLGTF